MPFFPKLSVTAKVPNEIRHSYSNNNGTGTKKKKYCDQNADIFFLPPNPSNINTQKLPSLFFKKFSGYRTNSFPHGKIPGLQSIIPGIIFHHWQHNDNADTPTGGERNRLPPPCHSKTYWQMTAQPSNLQRCAGTLMGEELTVRILVKSPPSNQWAMLKHRPSHLSLSGPQLPQEELALTQSRWVSEVSWVILNFLWQGDCAVVVCVTAEWLLAPGKGFCVSRVKFNSGFQSSGATAGVRHGSLFPLDHGLYSGIETRLGSVVSFPR